ncbi:helix-turn-helix domain-containing protein [[Ruminococcus] torques]|uniref:helix-turn-helix domain-containing protein n=1 Tax=[Ruminococcus] torques TaxID=33039 RepID=UPI0032BFA4C5
MGHTAIIKLIDNILQKEGDFISRLKDLRKERGYTQIKMQHLTGIDQSDYSKIENGKRYYTFEQCRKIALALNTSMDYLAELTDEKTPYPRSTSRK